MFKLISTVLDGGGALRGTKPPNKLGAAFAAGGGGGVAVECKGIVEVPVGSDCSDKLWGCVSAVFLRNN